MILVHSRLSNCLLDISLDYLYSWLTQSLQSWWLYIDGQYCARNCSCLLWRRKLTLQHYIEVSFFMVSASLKSTPKGTQFCVLGRQKNLCDSYFMLAVKNIWACDHLFWASVTHSNSQALNYPETPQQMPTSQRASWTWFRTKVFGCWK